MPISSAVDGTIAERYEGYIPKKVHINHSGGLAAKISFGLQTRHTKIYQTEYNFSLFRV